MGTAVQIHNRVGELSPPGHSSPDSKLTHVARLRTLNEHERKTSRAQYSILTTTSDDQSYTVS